MDSSGVHYSDFAVSPSSVTIEIVNGVNKEAVFRCHHGRQFIITEFHQHLYI